MVRVFAHVAQVIRSILYFNCHLKSKGHGTSSVLEHLLEVHWVVGSIAPGGPVEILLAQLCTLSVNVIMQIKDPLLLIGKSSP